MAARRLPAGKAKATGAALRNPGRHKDRKEPASAPLGGAPAHLDLHAKRAWDRFRSELPWLTAADKALLEIASMVRGEMLAGEIPGVTKLSMYQSVLSKLGATPTDRSKVNVPDDEAEPDEFFGHTGSC
jgi:phage terminase small subunit